MTTPTNEQLAAWLEAFSDQGFPSETQEMFTLAASRLRAVGPLVEAAKELSDSYSSDGNTKRQKAAFASLRSQLSSALSAIEATP